MFDGHRKSLFVLLIASALATFSSAQTETVLYNFAGGSDGMFPSSGLQWDAQGNLYGLTSNGGNSEALRMMALRLK